VIKTANLAKGGFVEAVLSERTSEAQTTHDSKFRQRAAGTEKNKMAVIQSERMRMNQEKKILGDAAAA
jgi:hypothetical protein